ncbi:MAG: hypothetical protein IIW54_03185 [Lachnospiraceae bacterium]|nr:hypothetical protein [Lachnospiraceae bacterium]
MDRFCVGAIIGTCKNCGCKVQIRQPWLSEPPVVNDGRYLINCVNSECHNYYGMEIREYEIDFVDFRNVDTGHICLDNEKKSNVIRFEDFVKGVCHDRYKNL